MSIKNLVFSGGGIKVIAYAGVISKLKEVGILGHVENLMGSSAGSIAALLLSLGINPNELMKLNYSKLKGGNFFTNSFRLLFRNGYYSTGSIKRELIRIFKKYNINKNITFSDPSLKYNIFVTVSNITTGKSVVLCKSTSPSMKLIDAVVMSCTIPFIFKPIKMDDSLYCDGGLLQNYNIEYFKEPNECFGFNLESKNETLNDRYKTNNIANYTKSIIEIMYDNANDRHIGQKYWDRTVFINCDNFNSFDFDISSEDKEELFRIGYNSFDIGVE